MTLQFSKSRRSRPGSAATRRPMGTFGAGVRAFQEDPPAVEAEVAACQAKVAETAAGRLLVERGRRVDAGPRGDAIQPRIVELPEPRMLDRQLGFDRRVAGRQIAVESRPRRGSRRRRPAQPKTPCGPGGLRPRRCGRLACTWIRPVFGSGRDEQVLDADGRHDEQLDRIGDAAVVVVAAGRAGIALVPAGVCLRTKPSIAVVWWDSRRARRAGWRRCGLTAGVTSKTNGLRRLRAGRRGRR